MGYGRGKDFIRNPKVNKEGLHPQEAKFAELVPTVGPIEAAKQAYPDATPKSQGEMASRNMGQADIIHSISKVADGRGVKRENCVDAIARGLSEDEPRAYLKAAELGLKLHGELREDRTILPVPVTKEQYLELCRTFWTTKPI